MRRLLLSTLLLLLVRPLGEEGFPARVVGVTDGDAITVLSADKRQVKIRLKDVDAPESGQAFGAQAKKAASDLAFGTDVTVRPSGVDKYGRTLAEVILPDGRSLNRELVALGWAWWHHEYVPHDRELERLEAEARTKRLGLWADSHPVPPWEWRKGADLPNTAGVVGNRRSKLYHLPRCGGSLRTSEKNRVEFETAEQAEASGYKRARDCGTYQ